MVITFKDNQGNKLFTENKRIENVLIQLCVEGVSNFNVQKLNDKEYEITLSEVR